jgi:DNA-directed RNA polymerase specialized sigma24 family protein
LAYLRTAVLRVAANDRRGAQRRARRHEAAAAPEQGLDHYPADLADLMRVAPRARAVLFLTIVEDHSYRDAAELVGCSEGAARTLASRALRELRSELVTEELS